MVRHTLSLSDRHANAARHAGVQVQTKSSASTPNVGQIVNTHAINTPRELHVNVNDSNLPNILRPPSPTIEEESVQERDT